MERVFRLKGASSAWICAGCAAVETLGHVGLAARAGPLALPLVGVAVLVALLKAVARLVVRSAR
jgi:hypothetical protein